MPPEREINIYSPASPPSIHKRETADIARRPDLHRKPRICRCTARNLRGHVCFRWRKRKKPCPGSRKHKRRALVGTDWKRALKKRAESEIGVERKEIRDERWWRRE
ncbi:hypothetical protein TNCV_639071 [Trichonephila clavipes]|nr:hypothetical protein TNCV_639071 [Trichonephila clavipes]